MTRRLIGFALVACSLVAPQARADEETAPLPAGTYRLDRYHASLSFSVSHLGFSNYTGGFDAFDATLEFDPANVAASSVTAAIDVGSLRIPDPPEGFRAELLGDQWLNAVEFPEMTFRSTSVTPTGPSTATVDGLLTLNGTSQPVTLAVTFNGGYTGHPMDPAARIGFSARGVLKRSAFGISFGIPAPGSTMGVGDDVSFEIEAEFNGPPLAPED